MVTFTFFLLAVFLVMATTTFGFALPSKEKDDGIFHVEDITLAGSTNADLVEKLTEDFDSEEEDKKSVLTQDFESEEEDKKSVEVAISVANIWSKEEDDDSNDKKEKSPPKKYYECADGMIFLSELGICVAYNPAPTLHPKNSNIYDIPQGDAPYVSSAAVSKTTYGKKDKIDNCKDGEILLSELDICAPSNPASPLPPKNQVSSIYDISQDDALAQLVKPEGSTELKDSYWRKNNIKPEGNHGCGKGELYLSELDICVPLNPVSPLPPKNRVSSIYDIPQGDAPAQLVNGWITFF